MSATGQTLGTSTPRKSWMSRTAAGLTARAFRFLRDEPLAHFLAIGAVLFAISSLTTPAAERARIIDINQTVHDDMAALFRQRFGRMPTAAEVQPLIDQWVRTEVLYREAIALGLDKGDQGLRDRMVNKMNLLVMQQARPGEPTEAQLHAWFEAHREKFDTPAEVDFLAVPFAGADGEAKARAVLAKIATGSEPDDVRLRARVYLKRPLGQIDKVFGAGFLDQLRGLKRETWSLAHGKDGWFVVRVDALHDAHRATYDESFNNILSGWRYDASHDLARGVLAQLTTHYVIRDTGTNPGPAQ